MFKSDVVGSLLRPKYLKDVRKQYEENQIDPIAFKKIEDKSVDEAIELQKQTGIEVITDGEMRRFAFFGHLIDATEGFDKFGGGTTKFYNEAGEELPHHRPIVVSKLKRKRHLCSEEFVYLRAKTDLQCKATIISPQQSATFYDGKKSREAYPKMDNYLADVIAILRGEIEELVRLGCSYIQIDAPQYTALLDPKMRQKFTERGNDPDKLLDKSIEMDNALIEGFPNVTFGIHLCRGNHQSGYFSSGDYAPIAKIFNKLNFQRFLLEFDDERSGGFEPLSQVADNKTVVLGLISTKTPKLEDREQIQQRIKEATNYLPLERLALSPQCGFASTEAGNLLTEDEQQAKLRLVSEIAQEVWG
jgi:5-methyltetrahydropteroyltriglutamate--homocysteine methyltransferase